MNGPDRLRDIVNRLMEALLLSLSQEAKGAPLGQARIDAVFERFMTSPDYAGFYDQSYRDLFTESLAAGTSCRRGDSFGRLMAQPLMRLFEAELLKREILPNLFSFFRMVLGEDEARFTQKCKAIVERVKSLGGHDSTWELYYRDEEARQVYWQVLARIAALFKRWDLRKEWFLKLMQYTPTTSSLGPMAFQVREPGNHDGSPPMLFGDEEFKILFHGLFDEFAGMTPSELALFRKEFGEESVKQIEQVLDKL